MSCLQRSMLAVVAAGALGTASAAPVALTTDGTWFDFLVGDVGDAWRSPLDGDAISFTLTSASAFTLRLIDIGFAGDRVDVTVNGSTLLGGTTEVALDDTVFAFTADDALAAPAVWSTGSWLLAAGSYTFTGTSIASPFGAAAWAISATAVPDGGGGGDVPEPGTWPLALGALGALALASRSVRGG
jgi:PEP-CTERM motif